MAFGLPRGCVLRAHVPLVAGRSKRRLSPAERDLARYVQVLMPRRADKQAVRAVLDQIECVEAVLEPPEPSLP